MLSEAYFIKLSKLYIFGAFKRYKSLYISWKMRLNLKSFAGIMKIVR